MRNLVLKDKMGQIIRVFRCEAEKVCLIYRKNKGRLDLCSSPDFFEKDSVVLIDEWKIDEMQTSRPIPLIQGVLEVCNEILDVRPSLSGMRSDSKNIWKIYFATAGVYLILIGALYSLSRFQPEDSILPPEPQLVKIIKPPAVVRPEKVVIGGEQMFLKKADHTVKKKTIKKSLKKMGALSALGSLFKKDSSQRAGLNLGAGKVSAGPGLRSLAGDSASGGVQDSLYSKGMITAALGSGGNIRGGGGHGTKGRQAGGGRAGYGKLTLTGSGGTEDLFSSSALSQQGGSFDFGIIDREIIKRIGRIRQCYDMALKTEPGLKGLFKIHFIISPEGRVALSKVHPASPTRSQKISSCVLAVINQIQFPVQVTSAIGIDYAFDLSALETEGGS